MFAFVSAPIDTHPFPGSLANNTLCGVFKAPRSVSIWGTYTAEGIAKLCEGLKGSAVTSLKCAGTPSVRFRVNAR